MAEPHELSRYLKGKELSEEEFYSEEVVKNKYTILLDCPGSGKSTLMKKLVSVAKEHQHFFFFLRGTEIHRDNSQNVNPSRLVHGLTREGSSVLSALISSKLKTVFVLDGLDELEEKERSAAMDNAVKLLQGHQECHLIISCRASEEERVVEKFRSLPFCLKALNEEDRRRFLVHSWQNLDNSCDLVEQAIQDMNNVDKDFLKTPWNLYVVSQIYADKVELKPRSVISVYNSYIRKRILSLNVGNPRWRISWVEKALESIALQSLFPEKNTYLSSASSQISTEALETTGIVVKKEQSSEFLHFSLVEFLTAEHFNEKLMEKEIHKKSLRFYVDKILLHPVFPGVLSFLNDILDPALLEDTNLKLIGRFLHDLHVKEKRSIAYNRWGCFWNVIKFVKKCLLKSTFKRTHDYLMWKPLCEASRKGLLPWVELLSEELTTVDIKDKLQQTPLFYAAEGGNIEVIKFLINRGANRFQKDINGHTPLYWACSEGHLDAVKELLPVDSGRKAFNMKFKSKYTPLHIAACWADGPIASYLLEGGSEINAKCSEGNTPLHLAIKHNRIESVTILLEHQARLDISNKFGSTPFMMSCQYSKLPLVKLVHNATLKHGLPVKIKDRDGESALHCAASNPESEVLDFILREGWDPKEKNWKGETPLQVARELKLTENVRILEEVTRGTS